MGRRRSRDEDARHEHIPRVSPPVRATVERTTHRCPDCGTWALNTLTSETELVAHKVPDGSRPCNY